MSRLPSLRRVLTVAGLLGLLTVISLDLNLHSWNVGGVTILWPPIGFMLGVLLCNPRRHWPVFLAIAGATDLAINLSLGDPFYICLYLSCCNLLEVVLGALLLWDSISPRPDLTQPKQLVAFLVYGVFLAPLLSSFAASFAQDGYFAGPTVHNVHRWFTADALSVATLTPLYLALHRRDRFSSRSWIEIVGLFALLAAVTFAVFWQRSLPLLFLVPPVLLLLGLRLRLAASALGLLLVSVMGGLLTSAGRGPTALIPGASAPERDLVLQSFIAVNMLLLYIVELRFSESERLRANLEGSERRFRLLAEASSDIIFRCDLTGRRSYVSPSVADVLGWQPGEILGGSYQDLVHPEDRDPLERLLAGFRQAQDLVIPAEFRYRKADGSYLWLEFNLRLFYDDDSGEPAGFVNIARDVSRRKLEEANLHRTLATAEQLAISDPLTGIANRRHFDQVLELEWLRAAREQTPMSLLLFDIDRFKLYNDANGHLRGDECLRQVVAAARPVVNRPADLLARYGGEEFVVVLPNTDAAGAGRMAEWIREAIEQTQLPHSGNVPYGVITISVGCATLVPRPQIARLQILERADQALYLAKASGRNCVKISEYPVEAKPARRDS